MASSSNSTVSRYRPVILTLVGATAAYTAWLIYTTATRAPSPPSGLHRSNAVRRNARPSAPRADLDGPQRIIRILSQPGTHLGLIWLFGTPIAVDVRDLLTPEMARQLAMESPDTMHPTAVEGRIVQFYDEVLETLMAEANRPMSADETEVVLAAVGQIPNAGLRAAVQRRRESRNMAPDADAGVGRLGMVESDALDITVAALPNGNVTTTGHAATAITQTDSATLDAPNGAAVEVLVLPPVPRPAAVDGAESIGPTEMEWHSDQDTEDGAIDTDGQTLQRTLYHIAEDRAR